MISRAWALFLVGAQYSVNPGDGFLTTVAKIADFQLRYRQSDFVAG